MGKMSICSIQNLVLFIYFFIILYFIFFFLTLQYCTGFAIQSANNRQCSFMG